MVQPPARLWLSHPGQQTLDIFVHMETLRRCGFTELRPGQTVLVRLAADRKG